MPYEYKTAQYVEKITGFCIFNMKPSIVEYLRSMEEY
jgi:hypothetical protein